MRPPVQIGPRYDHLEPVEWPKDLLGPNYWRPDSKLVWDMPNEIKEGVGRVTRSCIRFYQKVKHQQAPMIPGDVDDPDAIHALNFALDRQDELEKAVELPNEHITEALITWLRERKRSLVKSMQAVVVAEKGDMYDEATTEPWEVKLAEMTNEHVDRLRFIFSTVMARIDFVAKTESRDEEIQPTFHEVIIVVKKESDIDFLPAPSESCWKIDDSLMENSTLKMRQAGLALYHHGRVLGATWPKLWNNEQESFLTNFRIIIRAMNLMIRNIDSIWVERRQDLPKEEEKGLLVQLRELKDTAIKLSFTLIRFPLPTEYDKRTVKIDSFGFMSVKDKDKYFAKSRFFFG